jgi:hypothetical protein
MRRHLRLVTAAVGAATLSLMAVAPAVAAAPVSQARANAVQLSVAGTPNGSGDVTAKNDGSEETRTGNSTPPISILGGQELLNTGVLAQEATARSNGTSAACAGLAGNGGSVAQIGSSRCLNPGTPVNGTLSSLDLSELILVDAGAEASQLTDAQKTLVEALEPLTDEINSAVGQAQAQLGNPGLVAGFGAVEGRCTAAPGSASGDATLASSKVVLQLPTGAPKPSITLLNLPVHPKPNTHLTTDLSDVIELILDAVSTDLNTSLDGALAPIDDNLVAPIKANIVKGVRDNLEKNLAPLEKDLIDVVLNRQIRNGNDSIKVSALDLSLLPAAAPQLGASAATLQIGNADCGPNGRTAVARPQAAPPKAKGLPTGVSAGYATAPSISQGGNTRTDDNNSAIALGAFALLVTAGAGFVTFRRLRD